MSHLSGSEVSLEEKRPHPTPKHQLVVPTQFGIEGKVKWYRPQTGYGFVVIPGVSKDVFVHALVLKAAGLQDLPNGQTVKVDYGPVPGKGLAASKIELL